MDRKQIEKMIAVALSPGAYEEEAIVALRKAREVVKKNPALAHPDPPPTPTPPLTPKPDHSIQYTVSKIPQFWLGIFMSSISQEAYGLGLRSKLTCDFSDEPLTTVDIRCDGPKEGCDAFITHLKWLLNHINSQPPK